MRDGLEGQEAEVVDEVCEVVQAGLRCLGVTVGTKGRLQGLPQRHVSLGQPFAWKKALLLLLCLYKISRSTKKLTLRMPELGDHNE